MILPDVISKEPLGIHAREGDDKWADILKWVHYVLLTAEEMGVTKANVDQIKSSDPKDPFMRRLLGPRGRFRQLLGLDNDVVATTRSRRSGTTARSTTSSSDPKALGLPRGLNNLWTKGGLHVRSADLR